MKIALLGKSNRTGGGASKCSELLATGLAARGHQVDRFTILQPSGADPGGRMLAGPTATKLIRFGHAAGRRWLGGEIAPLELPWVTAWPKHYDLVHINDHWKAVSPWTVTWLARRLPVVLTLHDASYFTGGCMYPYDCERFTSGCGHCPQQAALGMFLDVTRTAWHIKQAANRAAAPHLLAPSAWMAMLAARCPWIKQKPSVILNCAPLDAFNRERRAAGRARLQLKSGQLAVLVGASSLLDERKGARLAAEAINRAAVPGCTTILLGSNPEPLQRLLKGSSVATGFLSSDVSLAEVYAAADLFIFPSLAENCPLSVIECLACGTPVVAFARGGTPELIVPGRDGDVLPEVSVEALARAITTLLCMEPDTVRNERAAAASRFGLDRFALEHEIFYQRVLHARDGQL